MDTRNAETRVSPFDVSVVDHEPAARRVVGREGEAEEPLLTTLDTWLVMSRNGASTSAPPLITRIVPPFSTTKSRSSAGGDVR